MRGRRRDEPVPAARARAGDPIVLQLHDRNAGDDPERQTRADVTRRRNRGRADRLRAVERDRVAQGAGTLRRPPPERLDGLQDAACSGARTRPRARPASPSAGLGPGSRDRSADAARSARCGSRSAAPRPIRHAPVVSCPVLPSPCKLRARSPEDGIGAARPSSALAHPRSACRRSSLARAATPYAWSTQRESFDTFTSEPMPTIADRERRLRELAAANVAVGSEASLEDVLQKTAEVAARLVSARYAALGVLDRTGSHLERLITTGIDEATRARIGDLPSDHGVLRVLLREARPVRVADVTKEQHFFGFPPAHPQMRSFLGVPIFVRGVVYGDLYLAEKDGGEFTEGDEEIVTLLAAQTGLTIEKVQIHEGATHWIRQLEALDELTRSVLEERDLSRLLELVARRLRELVGARAVLISLPASSGGLRVVVADGEGRRRCGRLRHTFRVEARAGPRTREERARRRAPRGSRGRSGPCRPSRRCDGAADPARLPREGDRDHLRVQQERARPPLHRR